MQKLNTWVRLAIEHFFDTYKLEKVTAVFLVDWLDLQANSKSHNEWVRCSVEYKLKTVQKQLSNLFSKGKLVKQQLKAKEEKNGIVTKRYEVIMFYHNDGSDEMINKAVETYTFGGTKDDEDGKAKDK